MVTLSAPFASAQDKVTTQQTTGSNVTNGTCLLSGTPNLYKRASCAAACYSSFCACIGGWQDPSLKIDDATEPDDFSRLQCVQYSYTSCSYYTSCASELIDCVNRFASSGCKDSLRLSMLASAVDGSYPSNSSHYKSCGYSTCDLFAQQRRSYYSANGWLPQCTIGENETFSRVCVNPIWFRGSITFKDTSNYYYLWYLRYGFTYYSNYGPSDLQLRTAMTADLGALFPGYNVTIQSLTTDPVFRMDFVVNALATNPVLVAGMLRGQRDSTWMNQMRGIISGLEWSYFGPRLYRLRSTECFSFDRMLPYAAVSGVPLTIQVTGKNETGCLDASAALKTVLIRAARSDDLKSYNFDWSYQSLWLESPNNNVGTLNVTNSLSNSARITVFCNANDTLMDLTIVGPTLSFYLGQVLCIKPFPERSANPPAHITAWVSTKNLNTLANTLLTVFTNLGPSTTLNATTGVFGSLPLEPFNSFSDFQSRANVLADGYDSIFVADPCASIQNGTQFPFATTNNLIVVGANYYGTGCTTDAAAFAFNAVSTWVAASDVVVTEGAVDSVILNRREVQSPVVGFPDASGIGARKLLQRYNDYRAERMPDRCSSLATSPMLIEVDQMEESIIRWNGACNVTQCCIAAYCAPIFTKRSCILPVVPMGGTYVVTLKTSGGTVIPTTTTVNVMWWSRNFYVSSYDYDYYWLPTTAPIDPTKQVSVLLYTYTKTPYCFRLVCVKEPGQISPVQNLTQFGDTKICNLGRGLYSQMGWYYSYYYYWYSVYGWISYDFDMYRLTFNRPAVVPDNCGAVLLNYVENRPQIFALNRPFEGGAVGPMEGAAAKSGGAVAVPTVVPLSPVADAATRLSWCRNWSQADARMTAIQARLDEMANCFRCPARIDTIMPRSLWRVWGWGQPWYNQYTGENGRPEQTCFETYGTWQGSSLPWRLRCCYATPSGVVGAPLIEGYPSVAIPTNTWGSWPDYTREMILNRIADDNPFKICCNSPAATTSTCAMYQLRRTVAPGTTNVFAALSTLPTCTRTWVPPPPNGWGWGDPYCTTFDGVGFECNFWGEALWTSCSGWQVHVSAIPVTPGAAATVINGVVVREGNDTVVVVRDPVTGGANVSYNGNPLDKRDVNGPNLTISFGTNEANTTSIRITSRNGHEVGVDALRNFLAVRAAADRNCIGKCNGLLGNCDGNKNNDLVTRDGSVTLPLNATGAQIFTTIVASFMIPANQSLFPGNVSRPPVVNGTQTSFTPTFITAELLASCPALCKGNAGCCLDAAVAGPAFANDTANTVQNAAVIANGTIPLTGYNWPPSLEFRSRLAIITGLTTTQTITATDSDGVASLSIDVCDSNSTGVSCVPKVVSSSTTKSTDITITVNRNFTITIIARDTLGAFRKDMMDVVALPPPSAPAFSKTFAFSVKGTGAWSAAEIYTLRVELATDLAGYINKYYSLSRRQSASPPPYTTPGDFLLGGLTDNSKNGTVSVDVQMYVLGGSDDESGKRLTALQAQSTMDFKTFAAALQRLVPGATVGTGSSGNSTSTKAPTTSPSESSSAVTASWLLSLVLCAILGLLF